MPLDILEMMMVTVSPQIHRAISPRHNDGRKHANRSRAVPTAHEDPHQRGADGNGVVRHVHHAVPRALALLYVHLRQPLQTSQPCEGLRSLALHE